MSRRQLVARENCRNWNKTFPPGTEVIDFDGSVRRTASAAGLGLRDVPSVFLEGGPEEPVPIGRLKVPGYVTVVGKRRTNESPTTQIGGTP